MRPIRTLSLLLLAAACVDDPTRTVREPEPDPTPAPRVVGVYEVTITGLAGGDVSTSVAAVAGPSQTLTPATTGLSLDLISSSRMSHGLRNQGGQRYFSFTYRVRNGSGAAWSNLTMLPVQQSNTQPGTPFSSVLKASGAPVDSAAVTKIVPAGAVAINDEGNLKSIQTDVLQVFEESEIAAITPPAGVTGIFPYGFVVRNPFETATRAIPHTTDPHYHQGAVTFAFRHPLAPSSADDPNTIVFQMLAVDDSETRITESIEEGQDSVAVRMIRERAAALGATTVTVLAGSPAADPAVADYPGQRQICSVRTAGSAGSPLTHVTEPGGYVRLLVLRPGESVNSCAAYFRSGTPGRPAQGVPFTLTLKAMDLYGNVQTAAVDSVQLIRVGGITPVLGPPAPLVSGTAAIQATWTYTGGYGTSLLRAVGRRSRGLQSILVSGVTRTWTGNVSTSGGDPGNWDIGAGPGSQDTAYIPAGRPFYPVVTMSGTIGGLIMEDGASFDLGAFDLTVNSLAWAGSTGGINSTTGRLILAGTVPGATVRGNLPRMQVTGSYTLAGPVASRAKVEIAGGRLRTAGFRMQTTSF